MALALMFCLNACDIEKEPYIQGAEDEKMILRFELGDVVGVVDEDAKTVVLDFEAGTDVSHLTPTITISTYATIEPESGVAQDFTNPVYYTVTAMNGTTAQYMVEAVVHDADNEKRILSFTIDDVEGDINEIAKTVTVTMPEGTDVTLLEPAIEVSEGATVSPASGEAQDFTTPVTYTVTAQNGTTAAYTVTVSVMGGTLEPTGKTVLIKDFTGARCVNCPDAATYAHNLQHQLGEDHIFIMSVHAGFLAQPMGSFPDFLTDEGTEWYNNHDSNPLFAVDHVALTDGNTLNVNQIDAPVAAALAEEQSFEIQVKPNYDETSRQLNVEVNALALADKEGEFSITVSLVEDHIIGWQTTTGGVDREYDFRNVLRGTLNGAYGDEFATSGVEANETFRFNYSTDLNADYNADECYLMVYIAQGDKILQTAVAKVN
jgi:hypothetical protein